MSLLFGAPSIYSHIVVTVTSGTEPVDLYRW